MLPIACSTPNPNPKSSPSAMSPGPKAGETAEEYSREPVSGIKPREGALASYLMARAAMRRHIDHTPDIEWEKDYSAPKQRGAKPIRPGAEFRLTGKFVKRTETLNLLRAGHETVQEVGDLMPLGRANVKEDIEKAKGEHTPLRKIVSQNLEAALESSQRNHRGKNLSRSELYRIKAVAGQYAKTGTCDNYSTSTTIWHAAKLPEMKDGKAIVAQARAPKIPHTWSEMMPMGKDEKSGKLIVHRHDVIMDGWCTENLAILREDGEFSRAGLNGRKGDFDHDHLLNHESGPRAQSKVEAYKQAIEASRPLQESFNLEFKQLVDSRAEPLEDLLWNSTSVFHANFQREAGTALQKQARKPVPGMALIPDAHPVSNWAKQASFAKIQAVGVSRSLGSNVRGAVADAPGIIASAREMFPDVESKPKRLLTRLSDYFWG